MATPFYLNMDNVSEKRTQLARDQPGADQIATLVLRAVRPNSWGLRAYGTGHAAGVFGINIEAHSQGMGVQGFNSGGGIGVSGEAIDEPAERAGKPQHGIGVYGKGPDFGVHGNGSYAGVSGISDRNGVEGHSHKEAGVYGYSVEGVGVVGSSQKGDAAHFWGDVKVSGDLILQGNKSAAVPFSDGSYRRLYCQESPECWFEDFGEGKLVNGHAMVPLDDGFAAVITGEYHVFLTPQSDCNGLFISERRRGEFEVREQGDGSHTLHFSYRVVGRRKDVAAPRFEKVSVPKHPEPSPVPVQQPRRPDVSTAD